MEFNLNDSIISSLINNKNKNYHEKVAEKLVNDILSPFPSLGDIEYDEKFNWDYKHASQANSYQIYLQGMNMINSTLNHFYYEQDWKYLNKSKEIFEDWMNYIENGNSNSMTWYDHTIASRSMALMKLMYFLKRENVEFDEKKYNHYLRIHIEKLTDDSLHRKNNHGLMMDRVLMAIGLFKKNEEWFLKGYERAKLIFWLMYSEKGVHLENSPEYHSMVYNMYVQIEEYLSNNNRTLGSEVTEKFDVIDKYRGIILKPDNRFPPIGDSSQSINKENIPMIWEDFHDASAGISILKNETNMLYLVFICGYSTITHKHSDDLSFILNYMEKDFFVDPGKYKYSNDKYRRYIVGRKAHNSFSAGRIPVKKNNSNRYYKRVNTDHFLKSKNFTLISGYIKSDENFNLRRTLYYIHQENIIIGFDWGESYREEIWTQRFNLSSKVQVKEIHDGQYKLINGEVEIYLTFLHNYKKEILETNLNSKWPKAFNSPSNGKIIKTKQILNSKSSSKHFENGFIVSMGENKVVNVESANDEYRVDVNGVIYNLPMVQA